MSSFDLKSASTSAAPVKPTATATIEPLGHRSGLVREHVIKLVIDLKPLDTPYADKDLVAATLRRALEPYAPGSGERDRREYREITSQRRGKPGTVTSVVIASEG